MKTGTCKCQFRRGSYPTTIHGLCFDNKSTLLGVTSDTETGHIFKINNDASQQMNGSIHHSEENEEIASLKMQGSQMSEKRSRTNSLASSLSFVPGASRLSSYMPTVITNVWEPARDFAFVKLPTSASRLPNIMAITDGLVQVVSASGWLGQYRLDASGGELVLDRQYRYHLIFCWTNGKQTKKRRKSIAEGIQ